MSTPTGRTPDPQLLLLDKVVPLADAARSLGIPSAYLYRQVYKGALPVERIGTHLFIPASELPTLRALARKITEGAE